MLLFITILYSTNSYAQDPKICGLSEFQVEEHQSKSYLVWNPDLTPLPCNNTTENKANLKLHICFIQSSDGTYTSDTENTEQIVEGINKYFSPFGIQFQRNYINVIIKDDDVRDYTSSESLSIRINNLISKCRTSFDEEGIIVYIFDKDAPVANWGFGGVVNDYYTRHSIVVDHLESVSNITKIIIHEIGHNLGLPHTFNNGILPILAWGKASPTGHIIITNSFYNYITKPGSDCELTGDKICDTPIDPGWWSGYNHFNSNTCLVDVNLNEYIDDIEEHVIFEDENGDPFLPENDVDYSLNTNVDIENHMSYNLSHCRQNFTEEQAIVMRCVSNNFPHFYYSRLPYTPLIVESTDDISISNENLETSILIENGGKLTLTGDIKFPYWAKITVEPGGQLNIIDATLDSYLENEFWMGIEVYGNGSPVGAGKLNIGESELKHARTGIFSKNGGRIFMNNSELINNKIGILIKDTGPSYNFSIKNSVFKTDKRLYDLAWHITTFDDEVYTLEGNQNEQEDHIAFIIFDNATIVPVVNNDFITTGNMTGNHQGIGILSIDSDLRIEQNTFLNQRVGIIKNNNSPGTSTTRIIDNTFDGNVTAIHLNESSLTLIEENLFSLPAPSVGSNNIFGVFTEESMGLQIRNNEFESDTDENVFFIASTDTNDGLASDIKYNSFGRTGKVAHRTIELHGDHSMLEIFCNDFTMTTDVEFAVGLEDGATLMQQGLEDRPAGNDWSNLGSCTSVNDESQLYKTAMAVGFTYYGFDNKQPDCVSNGINVDGPPSQQPGTYCEIPIPPSCPKPFLQLCDLEIIQIFQDDIRGLTVSPPSGMSEGERQAAIKSLKHSQYSLIQSSLIQLVTEDTIPHALEYLDSVALITDHFEDIAEMLALRYAEMVQYPGQEYVKVDLTSILDKTFFSAFTHTFTPLIYSWSDIVEISEEFPAIPDLVIQHLIPNPATSEVTIRLTGEDGNGISIREVYLYDLTGRAVYHSDMLSQDIILNVSEYNSGIYLTKVIDAFGRATYDKLMIVR